MIFLHSRLDAITAHFNNVFASIRLTTTSKNFMCECLPACIHVHHVHACGPWRLEEGDGFPGTGFIDGCKHCMGMRN